MILLDCTPSTSFDGNSTLSILSIVLGVLSIALSVVFYIKSSELSKETKISQEKIESATNELKALYNNYVKEIFQLFKNTHEKMSNREFGETSKGGSGKTEGGPENKNEDNPLK